MATAGSLVVNILGKSQGLEKSLNKSQKLLGNFAGFAAKALGTLAAGFTFGKAIEEAMNLETAHTQFSVLLGDGEAATQMMERLRGFAAETPFQFGDISDSTKLLLNAGIAAEDMTDSLRMMGDLAAAGGKNLSDVAFVFSQVRSAGVLMGQDLNQLLNANIPAIKALAGEFNVAEGEVKKLVSTGAVTFDRLESAMQRLTGEGGQLEGMTMKLSQTTAGLWSTVKDNVTSVLAEFGTAFIEAADVKSWLSSASGLIGQVPALIKSAQPVMEQFFNTGIAMGTALFDVLSTGWTLVSEAASIVFDMLGVTANVTFTSVVESAVAMLAAGEYVWSNLGTAADLAFTSMQLGAVTAFNTVTHFFTNTIPELLNWFGENWESVFFTAFDLTTTMLINFGQNVRNIMAEVWSFIASGGTDELELTWEPLTKGFHNAISQLPELTEREIGAVEKALGERMTSLGDSFTVGLGEHVEKKLAELMPGLMPTPAAKLAGSPIAGELDRATDLERAAEAGSEKKTVNQQALTAVSGMDAISSVNQFNRDMEAQKAESAKREKEHREAMKARERQAKAAESMDKNLDNFTKSVKTAGAVE